MKSLAELEAIRNKAKGSVNLRKDEHAVRVVVGMATCGIASAFVVWSQSLRLWFQVKKRLLM